MVAVTGGGRGGRDRPRRGRRCRAASSPPACCSRPARARSGSAPGLELAPRFTQALRGFRFGRRPPVAPTRSRRRRREADDGLVLAAGLCVWPAGRGVPGLRGTGRRRPGQGACSATTTRMRAWREPVILGLDPGQRRDPAGLAVLERLDVIHLARLPLGTSYDRVADHAADLGRACEAIVVDATGAAGRWLDMLLDRAPRSKLVAVTLTGGGKVHVRDGPARGEPAAGRLFLPLQAALEAGRLRVAEGCPYARRAGAGAAGGARRAVRRGEPGRGAPRRPDDGRGAGGVGRG